MVRCSISGASVLNQGDLAYQIGTGGGVRGCSLELSETLLDCLFKILPTSFCDGLRIHHNHKPWIDRYSQPTSCLVTGNWFFYHRSPRRI